MNKKLKLLTDRDRLKKAQKDVEDSMKMYVDMRTANDELHRQMVEVRKESSRLLEENQTLRRTAALYIDLMAYLLRELRQQF